MKSKKFAIIFACLLLLPWLAGCKSSPKSANLILYSINERTDKLEDLSTGVYILDVEDAQPQKIYEAPYPPMATAWLTGPGIHPPRRCV